MIDLAATGLPKSELAPKQTIQRVYVPQKAKQTQFLQGSAKEVAAQLVDKLKNESRVI